MTDFLYQSHGRCFAQVPDGAVGVATEELLSLGATESSDGYRGVYFRAEGISLYRIAYCARTVSRVLAPLITFDCHSDKYLYRRAQDVDWPGIFDATDTFAVVANVSNSRIRHSQYAALKVKDAIVDQFRARGKRRPNVDARSPDLWINLYLHANKATLSIDLSGGAMHRRGYRKASVEAPIQETVAAAIVRMTGWDGSTPLHDPMCGSGTLLGEALMHAGHVPAAFLRRERLGLRFLPDFDEASWRALLAEVDGDARAVAAGLIAGGDVDPEAVAAAKRNLRAIPGGDAVAVRCQRFEDIERIEGTTIVCNPPYGRRVGGADTPALITAFGDFLKRRCAGSVAYLYLGDRDLVKRVGLRPSWKRPLANGGLDGRLVRYDLY